MNKLRIGILGAGRATQEISSEAFKYVSKGALVAICDTNEQLVSKVAGDLGAKAYTNFQQMVEKEKIQVVILNTPVPTHAPLAIEAMKLGVDVIVEKPAVDKLSELQDIKRVSEQTGRKFTVVHNYKYYEGPQKALKLYKEGVIGDILHIDRYWMTPPQNDRMESNSAGWWHKMKGGRLADALPHFLYIPHMFIGDMELLSVSARKFAEDRPWSFCDESNITLQTPKSYLNIRQSVNMDSWPYKGYIYHTFIYGSKLALVTDHHRADILFAGRKKEVERGMKAAKSILKEKIKKDENKVSRGAHNVFYDKFFEYVMGEGPNPSPWNEIVNVASLTEEIAGKIDECVRGGHRIVCNDGVSCADKNIIN